MLFDVGQGRTIEMSLVTLMLILFGQVLMLEFWKRKEARLAMRWGMSDFEAVRAVCMCHPVFPSSSIHSIQ